MPTGYTDRIYKGIGFEDFVLSCSRAFGALIHMRDDDVTAEITLPVESDFHTKELKKKIERRMELSQMSELQKKENSHKKFEKAAAYQKEAQAKRAIQRAQLEEMLVKVALWTPPTEDHVGLKEFMVKQIKETIEQDCCGYERYETPVVETPTEWYEATVERTERDIEYYEEKLKEARERNGTRHLWITALFESIGRGDQVKTLKTVKF